MAVSCHVAFGHYLRTLRERRGLALEDVWTLSQTFPESLNKGYLSRCENGKQKLALPKVVAVSRIYEVPSDVLVERLELDLELEKIGGPPTEKLSWGQLRDAGTNALRHGHRWAAYAFFRDATLKVAKAELDKESYACVGEQIANSFTNCATAGRSLGKYRYALQEYRYAETSGSLGPDSTILINERLAATYFCVGDHVSAERHAKLALAHLEKHPESRFGAYLFEQQGFFLVRNRDYLEAIPWFQKAYDAFKKQGTVSECANVLIGLTDCYQESGNLGAATRTLDIAKRICDEHSLRRLKALTLALQGIVDEMSARPEAAEENLRDALSIAKELNDRILRFKVEFYLYKHALGNGKAAAARSIRRRLDKLLPSVPNTVEQVLYLKAIGNNQVSDKN